MKQEKLTQGDNKFKRKPPFSRYDDNTEEFLAIPNVWLEVRKEKNDGYPSIRFDTTRFTESKIRKMLETMQEDYNDRFIVESIESEGLRISEYDYFGIEPLTKEEIMVKIKSLLKDLIKVQDIKRDDLMQLLKDKLGKTKLIETGINCGVIGLPDLDQYDWEEGLEVLAEQIDYGTISARFDEVEMEELLIALYDYTDCTFEELLDKVEKSA